MDDFFTPGFVLLLLMAFGAAVVAVWASIRWSRLKPVLFPQSEDGSQDEIKAALLTKSDEKPSWLKDVPAMLSGLDRLLESAQTPEAHLLLKTTRKLEAATPELANAIQSVLIKALESTEVHSLLVKAKGLYAYIVVVPNRHEHPHLIRRHESFSAGWTEHARVVRASLISSGAFSALIAYLFFISPNDKEGVLLLSYADDHTILVPSGLLQAADLKLGNIQPIAAALDFNLSP